MFVFRPNSFLIPPKMSVILHEAEGKSASVFAVSVCSFLSDGA